MNIASEQYYIVSGLVARHNMVHRSSQGKESTGPDQRTCIHRLGRYWAVGGVEIARSDCERGYRDIFPSHQLR